MGSIGGMLDAGVRTSAALSFFLGFKTFKWRDATPKP
jgi:hypothetical protein